MKQAKIKVLQSMLGQLRLLVNSTDEQVAAAAAEQQAKVSTELALVMREPDERMEPAAAREDAAA